MSDRRIPPQNIHAEMAVLGALFVENESIGEAKAYITADDFYREPHRKIFRAADSLISSGSPCDLVSLATELKRRGHLEEVGGGAYLATLLEYVPTSANIRHYSKLVKESAALRSLITAAEELREQAFKGEVSAIDLLADMKSRQEVISETVTDHAAASDLLTLEARAREYARYVKNLKGERCLLGLQQLDSQIRGIAPGEVCTIIAYSGTYKTGFLQNVLLGNARNSGKHALFFSLEMPGVKTFEREGQIILERSGQDIEAAFADPESSTRTFGLMKKTGAERVITCDKSKLTIDGIARYIEVARRKFGPLCCIGVDYLQLIQAPGKIFEKTEYVATEMKNLAKEYRVPVFMLSQVSRTNSEGEIRMDAGKGGGAVEAAADFLVGMWAYQSAGDADQIGMKLLKNRNGPNGSKWTVDLDRRTFRFNGLLQFVPEKQVVREAEQRRPVKL